VLDCVRPSTHSACAKGDVPPCASLANDRVARHAADIAAVIEHLGLGPADVMGHSYGGVVALSLAKSHPDLVRRLILAEPSLFGMIGDKPVGSEMIAGYDEARSNIVADLASGKTPTDVTRDFFGGEKLDAGLELRRRIILANVQTLAASQAERWWALPFTCADAKALSMAVLLVEGARSHPVVREVHGALLGCLPDVRRVVIPGSGHLFQFDAPEATGRAVLDFVTAGS
jgi:pimeloyl-ACP methyl ester carboxylesterase